MGVLKGVRASRNGGEEHQQLTRPDRPVGRGARGILNWAFGPGYLAVEWPPDGRGGGPGLDSHYGRTRHLRGIRVRRLVRTNSHGPYPEATADRQ